MYEANALKQYAAIAENGAAAFAPQFDADGNQTLVKTDTGIWSAVYNAEKRPIRFTNEATNTVVECAYDSMGRRAYKKLTTNGTVTLHQRYMYRDYLQIACIDLTRSHHPTLWFITWILPGLMLPARWLFKSTAHGIHMVGISLRISVSFLIHLVTLGLLICMSLMESLYRTIL